MQDIFIKIIPKIFKPRLWIPRYDRKVLINEFKSNIGEPRLNMLFTNFIATAIDVVADKVHYFKSWENKDSVMFLLEAILCSSAAPYYFGRYVDESGTIWLDGGVGLDNNPILITLTECFRQGWVNNPNYNIHILSIGTGYEPENKSKKNVDHWTFIDEILYYIDLPDGGRARSHISMEVENYIKSMELNNVQLYSINSPILKKYNITDGVKYMEFYKELGLKFSETPESLKLIESFKNSFGKQK